MPVFAYRVREPDGSGSEGWMEAENEEALIRMLHRQGKVILSVEHERTPAGRPGESVLQRLFEPRVSAQELVSFATQLSAMVDAGLPLLKSLRVLMREAENIKLRRVLTDVATSIEAGASFHQALAKQPIFSNLFISLVRAGEASGRLDETLRHLARYMENVDSIRKKARNALIYPAFLAGVSLMVMMIMVIWLIPAFSRVYMKFQANIPDSTLMLMDLSRFARDHASEILVLAAATGLGLWAFQRTESGRYLRDALILKVPRLGPLFLKSILARFSRTLGVLVGSGIPFMEALELTTQATDNRVLRRALRQASMAIEGGRGIAAGLEQTGLFPSMLVSMTASGEEAGALHSMLIKAADFYDQQVETNVSALMSILGPALILFLAAIIGSMLVVMYMPVFNLGRVIH